MTDWELIEEPKNLKRRCQKVRPGRVYKLKPGNTHLYHVGEIHSPSCKGPIRVVRIEGSNLEKMKRRGFTPIHRKAG